MTLVCLYRFLKGLSRESFQCRQVNLHKLQFHLLLNRDAGSLKTLSTKALAITNTHRALRKGSILRHAFLQVGGCAKRV